jgi:hypothetical protein
MLPPLLLELLLEVPVYAPGYGAEKVVFAFAAAAYFVLVAVISGARAGLSMLESKKAISITTSSFFPIITYSLVKQAIKTFI